MNVLTLIMIVIIAIEMVYCGEYCSSLPAKCNVTVNCWVGDGWCDWNLPGYNTPECGFDGGDCCPETCRTTLRKHECGCNGYVCVGPIYQPTSAPTTILPLSYQPSVYSSDLPHTQAPTTSITTAPSPARTEVSTSPTSNSPIQSTSPIPVVSIQPTVPVTDRSMSPSLQPVTSSPTPTKRSPGSSSERPSNSSPTKPRSHTTRSPSSTPVAGSSPLPTMESLSRQPVPLVTSAPTNVPQPPLCVFTETPTRISTHSSAVLPTVIPSRGTTRPPSRISSRLPTRFPLLTAPTGPPTPVPSRQPTRFPSLTAPTGPPALIPSRLPTRSPSLTAPTGPPTPVPSRQPTRFPSQFPVTAPTGPPTQIPTGLPTRSTTIIPTRFQPSLPTTIPTTPPTRRPSQVPTRTPTIPLRTAAVTYFLINITADATQATLPDYDAAAIAQSMGTMLFAALGVPVNITITSTSAVGSVRNLTSQARRLRSQEEDREQVWNVTQQLQWWNQSGMQVYDIQSAVNASLSSGSLQRQMRSQCVDEQCNLLHAVLCGSLTDSACLLMTPTVPTVVTHSDSCPRSSSPWRDMYAAPQRLPWYAVWLGAQGVVWAIVGVASGGSSSRWTTVAVACTAAVHAAYSAVLLWEYFLTAGGDSMACVEFAFLDILAAEHSVSRLDVILIFLRGLIYPLLLVTGICLLVKISPSSSSAVNNMGNITAVSFTVTLNVCFLLVLFGNNRALSAAQLVRTTLWMQLCCAVLLCVSVVFLLLNIITSNLRTAQAAPELKGAAVLRDLEAECASADWALTRGRQMAPQSQQQLPVLEPPVRLPMPQRPVPPRVNERLNMYTTATLILVLVSAVLSIATSFPATLAVPITALVLYSVASRLCELYVALALLGMLRTQAQPQLRLRTPTTPQSTQELMPHSSHLQQHCASASAATGRSVRSVSAPLSLLQPSPPVHLKTEAPRVNYWYKGWKWMFTPRDIVTQDRTQSGVLATEPVSANREYSAWQSGVKRWQPLSRSSSSSDSTDSGENYF